MSSLSPVVTTVQWSDAHLPITQRSQRQCLISLQARPTSDDRPLPLNLGLVLDCSGSMQGEPMLRLRQAVAELMKHLRSGDRLAIIRFNHSAQVICPSQEVTDPSQYIIPWAALVPSGGTAIDQGLRLGLEELTQHRRGRVSGLLLLTDGENEHGETAYCLRLGRQATQHNITIYTVGLGSHWGYTLLEQLADLSGGCVLVGQRPDGLLTAFQHIIRRMRWVRLMNTVLWIKPESTMQLAHLHPITQTSPEVVDLVLQPSENWLKVRLGDLFIQYPRQVLLNLYVSPLPTGRHPMFQFKVSYEYPPKHPVMEPRLVALTVIDDYQGELNSQVEQAILRVGQYRQAQLAQDYLYQGNQPVGIRLLRTAVETATQLGNPEIVTALDATLAQLDQQGYISADLQKQVQVITKTQLYLE